MNANPPPGNPTYVRAGYSYIPQQKEKETALGGIPIAARMNMVGGYHVVKSSQLDVTKSMTTDLIHSLGPEAAPHRDKSIAGVNALFGDGHVLFQGAKRVPRAFELWKPETFTPRTVRMIVHEWKP